ncbi:gastric triacylglycerol lipase-like [Chrysoperla carnea]|uniref:gastric triacylglycerol lipase-like n=1 Tax=Chrysoperla carnea TaxID=189513 RepID=UPI001D0899A7|nr:gastric triacylglycerol lipase-like [Chrysoperla carnea]
MFRIPNKKGQPIILQHGLVADSSCFLLKKEDSLPFLLSRAGYDVWLPNFRGTMYSNSHIKYKRENEEYWNWSWDELAAYDLSRTLEIVGKMTNQTGNILYIGYSMGTTTFFALMASKPEYNRYVKAMFALAPVVYVNHMKGPTKLIAFFTRFLFNLRKAMGGSAAVFANIHNYRKLIVNVCSSYLSSVCRIILFLGSGFDVPQLTMKTLYNVYGHLPSSTSIKVTVHYGQQINSGDFGYFDYGEEENKIRYGSKRPPLYNISKITVPIAIYCGKSDWRSQLQITFKTIQSSSILINKYLSKPLCSYSNMKQTFKFNSSFVLLLQTLYVLLLTISMIDSKSPTITDVDVKLKTPALIAKYGYPSEAHTIITDDGFILTIHRIPHSKGETDPTHRGQPILLQHGLISDSSCFFLNQENSLPFLLSDAGYDVWLSNIRATTYSSGHTKYDRSDVKYWDWSWDEIAAFDLARMLKFIGQKTNQIGNILYIGHSMGTTTFFALMASKPQYNKYVKSMFALAPVAYVNNIKGPLSIISTFSNNVYWVYKALGTGQFIPNASIFRVFVNYGCSFRRSSPICQNLIFLLTGFDKPQFDQNKLPLVLGHLPSPTSVRTVVHFGQGVRSGKFRYYDFGGKENEARYGTKTPPQYNISQITVPIALYCGQNDWLSQLKDVERFWEEVPTKLTKYVIPYDNFNHGDFIWAKDVKTLLYNQLLSDIKKFS